MNSVLGLPGFHLTGFPHSDIPGSMFACNSPGLFAAYHVLHRSHQPRHSPSTLNHLTFHQSTASMTSFLRVILWILHPERMDSPAFNPTESSNSMDHPSIFVLRLSKKFRSTLELRSKASSAFQLRSKLGGPRWIRTTDLTLIRRAL